MAPSAQAQYYLAQADEYLKLAANYRHDTTPYQRYMSRAREYWNLAAIEQGLPVPPDREH